jgi:hypothetical protein
METPFQHPLCRLCRDGTYATMCLKMFSDEDCEWTHYCDPCGEAMASVIRDGQKREPERQVLAPPPEGKAPEPTVKTRAKKKAPEAAAKAPAKAAQPTAKAPEAPPPPAQKTAPAKNTGGYDLLALLGMK